MYSRKGIPERYEISGKLISKVNHHINIYKMKWVQGYLTTYKYKYFLSNIAKKLAVEKSSIHKYNI